jgi:hypothetical protein
MYECGVPGGALNLNSTGYPDHRRNGDLSLQGEIPTAEPGIEPGTSWLVVRSSDPKPRGRSPKEYMETEIEWLICQLTNR